VGTDVAVDTCIWVNFFNRPQSREKRAVDALIDESRVVVPGPVLAEVIQGCGNTKEAEWVASLLGSQKSCLVTEEEWRAAGMLGLELRRKGTLLPLSDLVIAASAFRHDLEVYSTDPHFRKVPGLRLFSP